MVSRILFIFVAPPVAYIATGLIVRHYMRERYLAENQPAWMGALAIGICATTAIATLCLGIWWLVRWVRAKKQESTRLPVDSQ